MRSIQVLALIAATALAAAQPAGIPARAELVVRNSQFPTIQLELLIERAPGVFEQQIHPDDDNDGLIVASIDTVRGKTIYGRVCYGNPILVMYDIVCVKVPEQSSGDTNSDLYGIHDPASGAEHLLLIDTDRGPIPSLSHGDTLVFTKGLNSVFPVFRAAAVPPGTPFDPPFAQAVPTLAPLSGPMLVSNIGARIEIEGGCNRADLTPPFGVLDLADIGAFVAAFTAGDPSADLAPPFGVLDLADINAFIQDFLAGCGI